jgi:hypothetical protein
MYVMMGSKILHSISHIFFRKENILGLFYGRPYHPIPLLEKDQYERIQRLRLIIYHHYLHMWYRVVCIGDMGGIGVKDI